MEESLFQVIDGYGYILVISLSAQGIENNPGFKITLPIINKLLMVLVYGDMFLKMTNRVRPYEKIKNSTKLLYLKWLYMIREIKRRYPYLNIAPIDYDPGASKINQLNRIKLMLSTAIKNLEKDKQSKVEIKD